ncbi:TIGR02679 domain-containing protein [Paenibacillus sp. DYY-L-2]|uniref:TIGR02679 domain-containing protein n=1 Tax=Paenibacillus sp. DYY-L-2 TaxID=3447013 RepID=UPI003F502D04
MNSGNQDNRDFRTQSVEGNYKRADRARDYFSQPGFQRMLQAVWNRYASLEKVGGHAVVNKASPEECESLNLFFGWNKKPGEKISIPLTLFEQELLQSPFPFKITELHEVLTGVPLMTKSDKQLLAMQEWQALFSRVENELMECGVPLQPKVSAWLAALKDGKAAGYRTLRDLWRTDDEIAKFELTDAVRAWSLLLAGGTDVFREGTGTRLSTIRLPVLAALATGNPHALDRNTPAGRLFFQVLRSANTHERSSGMDLEEDSEKGSSYSFSGDTLETREVYRCAGILDDDISSLVYVYQPFGMIRGPFVLTLRQVESSEVLLPVTDIYVVENPAIFSTLADWTDKVSMNGTTLHTPAPLLLCTSGPASAAALRLIDRYMGEGLVSGSLYYSGDFDIKGIEIGNVLAARYNERFTPWCFGWDSYLEGQEQFLKKSVTFTKEERLRLERMKSVWDESLCRTMGEMGTKLFQEQMILRLLEDWKKAVRGGENDVGIY